MYTQHASSTLIDCQELAGISDEVEKKISMKALLPIIILLNVSLLKYILKILFILLNF